MPRFSPFYRAYLQSPQWQQVRQAVLARDGYRCVRCGSRHALEVDHLTYVRLGREALSDCQTLCHACHVWKTRRTRRGRRLARVPGWLLALAVFIALVVFLSVLPGRW